MAKLQDYLEQVNVFSALKKSLNGCWNYAKQPLRKWMNLRFQKSSRCVTSVGHCSISTNKHLLVSTLCQKKKWQAQFRL